MTHSQSGPSPAASSVDSSSSLAAPSGGLAGQVHAGVEHDVCGSLPDIEVGVGRPLPANYLFDPAAHFLGFLTEACRRSRETGTSLELLGLNWPAQIRPGPPLQVCIAAKEAVLRPFCILGTPAGSLQMRAATHPAADAEHWVRAEDLLWNVGLWTSRGRLPAGVDVHAPVKLGAWPNFTRTSGLPHAMQIAALWTREAQSPLALAKRLDIPQRVVFTFFSAGHASGLLLAADGNAPADVPKLPAAPAAAPAPERKGLFARILRTLTHAR